MPTTTEALLVLHWGDKVGAIADYTETVRLDPKYISAYINRGNTRFQMGDKTGARTDLQQAASLLNLLKVNKKDR